MLFQDSLLSLVASLFSILLVRWLSAPISDFTSSVFRWLGCSLVAFLCGELVSGSFRLVYRWATVRSFSRVISCIAVKESLLVLSLALSLVRLPSLTFVVLLILADVVFSLTLLFYLRFAVRYFSRSTVSEVKARASRMNALVWGTDRGAVLLAEQLRKEYNVVGFLTEDRNMSGRVIADTVVYYAAGQEDVRQLEWRLGGVDCVFFPRTGEGECGVSRKDIQQELEVLREDQSGMSLFSNGVKRAFDLCLSGVLMLVFSPLALFSAIAVKLEDGGPVLYAQERMGRGGIPFSIYKFRSMRTDAEKDGAQLYSGDADSRLTKVGGFLRRHHLDELPQLWNVFRGDMSFIGYRPERQYYITQIMQHNPRYRYLYQIRPGVTSYATLYNGYTDTMDKMLTRLDLDLYYLRNQSLLFDAKVLGLTFLSIISGKEF